MNLFDIIVLAIVISSTLMGLYKGLIRLTIGLISFCLSLAGTYFLLPVVEVTVFEHIQNTVAINITSGLIAYLISMLFCAFLSSQVVKMVDGISGGLVDRTFGLAVGALRGLIISSGIFGIVAIFTSDAYLGSDTAKDVAAKIDHAKYPKWLTSAATYDIIENSAKIMGSIVSDKTLEEIKLPKSPKKLPEIPPEVVDKVAGAAAQVLIEHAVHQASDSPQPHEAEGAEHKASDEHDNLDSQLKEVLGQ